LGDGCERALQKLILTLLFAAALVAASGALAGDATPWRVHYTVRGAGRDITVLAQSSAEARRLVMDMFPGAGVARRAR
jgi:hypothetical protein